MISNIQLLRALAAMAVVYFHASYIFGGIHTDLKAVAVFFVVSGFIMTHISRSRPDGFMPNRIKRIVPLYWMCTIAFFLLVNLELSNPLYKIPQVLGWLLHDRDTFQWYIENKTGFTDGKLLDGLVRSLAFVPYRNEQGFMFPVLGVGWTLNLEMYFYAIFSICLLVNVRWAPIITALVIVCVKMAAWTASGESSLLTFYADRYTGFFVLGILIYYVFDKLPAWIERPVVAHRWTVGSLIALLLIVFNCFPLLEIKKLLGYWPAMMLYFALPSAVVLLALVLHKNGVRTSSRIILALGEASFSIYLTHPFVAVIAETTFRDHPITSTLWNAVGAVAFVTVSGLVGLAAHHWIELPIIRAMRKSRVHAARISTEV
ncbi:hypothetical protein WK55_31640 [Burkholderia ubonensis]|uniref:acyltransferase family protein n=1 Tax=Burkholderia ubonensis TaxID=101571 RepID=UPI00075B2028|nr:acyltransferase [Burkholderia ubonensis]KVT65702.1 hypothetical protein WK55_31640 [Burkholderia ubonensis]